MSWADLEKVLELTNLKWKESIQLKMNLTELTLRQTCSQPRDFLARTKSYGKLILACRVY